MSFFLWALAIVFFLAVALYLFIRKVPHGWVEFKSGLILKFLPPLDAKPIQELRPALESFIARNAHKVKVQVRNIEEITIPTRHGPVPGKIFDNGRGGKSRTIFFIHGGGWCICSVNTHHEQIKRLVESTGLPVVAIDYSLSPEHKFPIAFEECVDAMTWLGDKGPDYGLAPSLVVMGDSAGGNLALTATRELTKSDFPDLVDRVVAIYPCTDGRGRTSDSHKLFEKGYYLTGTAMDIFAAAYIRSDKDRLDTRVSPILVADWSGYPATFILTAEFDPLRDEGEILAKNMMDDGVRVKVKRYPGAIHGFFGLKDFGRRGLEAVHEVANFLG